MKALVLENHMDLRYEEVPPPVILPNEVLLRVKAVGICGSDVHGIDGSTGRRIPPIIMGHEASGVIEKKGDEVKDWSIGDRVTFDSTIYNLNDWYTEHGMYNLSDGRKVVGVSTEEFKKNGAFAEFVSIPQHVLYSIPESVSFTQAALVEPAAVAMHAINVSGLQKNDVVVVVGAGMVGMLVIQLLKIRGCKKIIAVDLDEHRLQLAKQSGADSVFKPKDPELIKTVYSHTDNRGADLAIEVVGITDTIDLAIELVRKGATITLVGNISPDITLPLQKIVTRQLRLQGSCAINGEYSEILKLIAEKKLDVTTILSAEAPLSEGAEWFKRLYRKEKDLMKVILKP
jgi:L-iditol 2-dehydrogenase